MLVDFSAIAIDDTIIRAVFTSDCYDMSDTPEEPVCATPATGISTTIAVINACLVMVISGNGYSFPRIALPFVTDSFVPDGPTYRFAMTTLSMKR